MAPVSRRFAAAACSPELLQEMAVELNSLPGVRSLTAWLARHGQHLRCLDFGIYPSGMSAQEAEANITAIATCLMQAGAAGQLAELTVHGVVPSTEWLAAGALRSLRKLRLLDSGKLRLSPVISTLTGLGSLTLEGEPLSWSALRLPTSVTRLKLGGCVADEMPAEVRGLKGCGVVYFAKLVH